MLPRHKIQCFVKLSRAREYIAFLMLAARFLAGKEIVQRVIMGFITYQITIGRDIHKAEHGPCVRCSCKKRRVLFLQNYHLQAVIYPSRATHTMLCQILVWAFKKCLQMDKILIFNFMVMIYL